ncbi:MAG: D-alanine--D-alanine ligase, partial [Candidatus Omnitrophota bacterium]
EKYIKGRELTVGILDGKVLPVIEIIPKPRFFDYHAKYHAGMTEYVVPAKLDGFISSRVQEAALAAHRLLGCFGCSRVDIILDSDNIPVILEVNTIPGFTATSLLPKAARVAGIDFGALCVKLLESAYEKNRVSDTA